MNYEADLRHRESKKKIFGEEVNKSRLEDKSISDNTINKKMVQNDQIRNLQEIKRELEQSSKNNRQLKKLLRQQRQKYDQLFQQYQELIEKNNLIEKEYINSKYQHNKEIKGIKKVIKDKIDEEIKKEIAEFYGDIHTEVLWEGIRTKIEKFIESVKNISSVILAQKFKKNHHKQNREIESSILSISKSPQKYQPQNPQQERTHRSQLIEISAQQKSLISPADNSENNANSLKQIVFEDEYYGQLDDYQHYQQKIMQRKNYELMKNCNRSSSDIRRKKIFNINSQVQH